MPADWWRIDGGIGGVKNGNAIRRYGRAAADLMAYEMGLMRKCGKIRNAGSVSVVVKAPLRWLSDYPSKKDLFIGPLTQKD